MFANEPILWKEAGAVRYGERLKAAEHERLARGIVGEAARPAQRKVLVALAYAVPVLGLIAWVIAG